LLARTVNSSDELDIMVLAVLLVLPALCLVGLIPILKISLSGVLA
jgi:hypothetical protein